MLNKDAGRCLTRTHCTARNNCTNTPYSLRTVGISPATFRLQLTWPTASQRAVKYIWLLEIIEVISHRPPLKIGHGEEDILPAYQEPRMLN